MFKTSLSFKPYYNALSYTWGDANDTRSIIVNGKEFNTTAGLFTTLHYIGLREDARVLWVDSICIDQSNRRRDLVT
jgi:hypothetical protein